MGSERDTEMRTKDAAGAPRGGMPGDGAGRTEDPGTRDAGVWPVSGPPSGNLDAQIHPMASFGQGDRGAAGYADSGQSEVRTVPPGGGGSGESSESGGEDREFGAAGSNFGEVDPGVAGDIETVGETAGSSGGAGMGNAVGGGGRGDVAATADDQRG